MGDRNWQGEPVLAAKIDPGGLFLAADRFFRYSALCSSRKYDKHYLDTCIHKFWVTFKFSSHLKHFALNVEILLMHSLCSFFSGSSYSTRPSGRHNHLVTTDCDVLAPGCIRMDHTGLQLPE